jgi:oligopeptide/dipeptide ABC transporter ATP-binding protein
MAILLITHDLGVVAENADVVNVMYASRVVEFATVETCSISAASVYRGVVSLGAEAGQEHARLETIPGNVPNPASFPSGCKFHPRCPKARELAGKMPADQLVKITFGDEQVNVPRVCVQQEPTLRQVQGDHWAACHFVENYATASVTTPRSNHRREVVAELTPESAAAV